MKIDLREVTANGAVSNLSGKDRGEAARKHYRLDELDRDSERVVVLAPAELWNINSSFFQGMFTGSVEALGGEGGFLDHYSFDAPPHILRCVRHGIDRILASRAPLVAEKRRLFA